jgi:eukaryotic-like serine/threonine-protein kinase
MEGFGPLHEVEESPLGRTIGGKWQIVRLIGRGGMSTVYEGLQDDGVRVAVKRLNPVLARSPNARTRFLREGRVANAVGHPNAVRVLDTHVATDGQLYLVMELLEGETLRQRCANAGGRVGPREVLDIGGHVLEVLAAAHAKGIFHRDIKPENIFLTERGGIKVLDFGIAAVRDEAIQDAHITQSGTSLGTPAFMAPEQARGRQAHVDARTDVWAVGATMFQCLTGRHVHEDASNANEALILAATQRAPSVSTFCPDVSGDLAYLVDRALALDPAERWQSADAMRGAIALAVHSSSASSPPPGERAADVTQDETPSPSAVHGERRPGLGRRTAIALVLAVLAAGGLTARALSNPHPTSNASSPSSTIQSPKEPASAAAPSSALGPEFAPPLVSASLLSPLSPAPAPARVVHIAAAPSIHPAASEGIPAAVLDRRK